MNLNIGIKLVHDYQSLVSDDDILGPVVLLKVEVLDGFDVLDWLLFPFLVWVLHEFT